MENVNRYHRRQRYGGVSVIHHHSDREARPVGDAVKMVYRICAIIMLLLVVMLTGAWAEGLQCWWQAWTIAGICTVVAYLMLRGAGDV